jgi:hypothetical protein
MKKIILAVMVLGIGGQVKAGYFQPINIAHPLTSIGFVNDFHGGMAPGAVVTIINHAPVATDLLGAVIEGWSPLTLGGTSGQGLGGPSVSLGTGFNVVPAALATGVVVLDSLIGVSPAAALATPLDPGHSTVTLFVGPQVSWVWHSLQHSVVEITLFIGPKIQF